ncbi:MAG TPA: DUF3667 domain-containing protein [Allosphingosinicella sp.]|nr:DUF3667 domain-containing protein [Allosphingosinicella sp.]
MLVEECVEALTHLDRRIGSTLRGLVLRPAALTRDWIAGAVANQVPPLRLFLAMVLLVFLVPEIVGQAPVGRVVTHEAATGGTLSGTGYSLTVRGGGRNDRVGGWLGPKVVAAMRQPESFGRAVETWAHRLSILMLPLLALGLALLFVRRAFSFYDHFIFAMHSLSFAGLAMVLRSLILPLVGPASGGLLLLWPIHLWMHMRGFYGTSIAGTSARTLALVCFSLLAFMAIVALNVAMALAEIRA